LTGPTICPICGTKTEEHRLLEPISPTPSPNEDCPGFDSCSVNKCPLSLRYAELGTVLADKNGRGDPETRCLARRKTRETIAAKYPGLLANGGLLDREVRRDERKRKARVRWQALPEEEKARRKAGLAEARQKTRRSGKALEERFGEKGPIG